MIKHVIRKASPFAITKIQPILFLSKALTPTTVRYWPIELEVTGVCWAVKKLGHIIRTAPGTMLFTDHKPIIGTISQVNLDRLSMKLLFLSTFSTLELHYKPGRIHITPDARSIKSFRR